MTIAAVLVIRACSTEACRRTPRPNYAICDSCVDALLRSPALTPARVLRLSEKGNPAGNVRSVPPPAAHLRRNGPQSDDPVDPFDEATHPLIAAGRSPRPGQPDLAVAVVALGAADRGASRDGAVRTEAPERASGEPSPRPGTSREPDGPGAVGLDHEAGRALPPARPAHRDTHSRPGAEPQGVTRDRSASAPRVTVGARAGQLDGDPAGTGRAIATASVVASPGRTAPA